MTPAPPPPQQPDAVATLIPYKNMPALIGYYCGVFAIIPCLFIGWAGLILGIMGLKKAKEHPEAKGKVHAWIGIIAGGLFALLWTVATIASVVGMAGSKH
ncbi:MAG: DUF4190 domain-containing protein [Myxococcaceae bacterium]